MRYLNPPQQWRSGARRLARGGEAERLARRAAQGRIGIGQGRDGIGGALLMLVAVGCTPQSARISDALAAAQGFQRDLIAGEAFDHVVYENNVYDASGVLHVYLEGDGSPWRGDGTRVARDPGPRNPLMLRLMDYDTAPSVYLGRPCYQGLAGQPECSPVDWTSGRYSARVVDSMARALARIADRKHPRQVVLIGHSGGGTLAMLMAARVPAVVGVVTLAGNLDPAQWARLHDYSPLTLSLNPSLEPPLPAGIFQLHVAAQQDRAIPPDMILRAAAHQPTAHTLVLAGIDHRCCWERHWPALLARLDDQFKTPEPRE